ncbi:beta-lactamase/transpeptidase-like protein [Leptodontidium sp. 2 PMI_412]|nr:beta-lactamase/transpeptidase-like protein [Leptodontidium sp. 2 PMI_412]
MEALLSRLQGLGPAIAKICEVSGTPGVSIGVLHQGEIFYTAGYGYRDLEAKLPPDEHTIYHVASISKGITALGVGVLVNEGKLSWETKLTDILPDFKQTDSETQEKTTIVDFMSNRTGLASQVQFWMQEFGRMSLAQDETLPLIAKLPQVCDFRTNFLYQNWGFSLAAILIQRLSGLTWGRFLGTHIFEPLGMTRTTTQRNSGFENAAKGYIALEDAGVQTTVHDLLTLYKHILESSKDQFERNTTTTGGSPLKELATILAPHITAPGYSVGEQAYGLGFTITDLPGTLGATGINGMYTSEMPVVGRGLSGKKRVWYHNGSLAAFLSCIHILPETNSAIVVLTNSIAKNDAADWLAQLILEAFIDNPEKNNYKLIAKESADGLVNKWHAMTKQLSDDRVANTTPRALSKYIGKYYNDAKNWLLDIYLQDGDLWMCMQGTRAESYKLAHYNYDTFSWTLTWDESARRGRFRNPTADYYLLRFQMSDDGAWGLKWTIDNDIPEGQVFLREGAKGTTDGQKVLVA